MTTGYDGDHGKDGKDNDDDGGDNYYWSDSRGMPSMSGFIIHHSILFWSV